MVTWPRPRAPQRPCSLATPLYRRQLQAWLDRDRRSLFRRENAHVGMWRYRLWDCSELSNVEKRKLNRRKICLVGEHSHPVCVTVKYRGKSIPALVNIGCDVSIAESSCKEALLEDTTCLYSSNPSKQTANGEHMFIEGVATVALTLGKRYVRHGIHVTLYKTELILGGDWMAKHRRLTWDKANHQVRFGDGKEWIALHREIDSGCRRVIAETSIVLLARQLETEISVRITREGADPFLTKESLNLLRCQIWVTFIAEGASYPLSSPSYESELSVLTLASKGHVSVSYIKSWSRRDEQWALIEWAGSFWSRSSRANDEHSS